MSVAGAAEAVLLVAGLAVVAVGVTGVVVGRDSYAKLHFAALVSTLAVPPVVAAVAVAQGLTTGGAKTVVAGLLVWATSPVLTHATARAARIREQGGWRVLPSEEEPGEVQDEDGAGTEDTG